MINSKRIAKALTLVAALGAAAPATGCAIDASGEEENIGQVEQAMHKTPAIFVELDTDEGPFFEEARGDFAINFTGAGGLINAEGACKAKWKDDTALLEQCANATLVITKKLKSDGTLWILAPHIKAYGTITVEGSLAVVAHGVGGQAQLKNVIATGSVGVVASGTCDLGNKVKSGGDTTINCQATNAENTRVDAGGNATIEATGAVKAKNANLSVAHGDGVLTLSGSSVDMFGASAKKAYTIRVNATGTADLRSFKMHKKASLCIDAAEVLTDKRTVIGDCEE